MAGGGGAKVCWMLIWALLLIFVAFWVAGFVCLLVHPSLCSRGLRASRQGRGRHLAPWGPAAVLLRGQPGQRQGPERRHPVCLLRRKTRPTYDPGPWLPPFWKTTLPQTHGLLLKPPFPGPIDGNVWCSVLPYGLPGAPNFARTFPKKPRSSAGARDIGKVSK
uniref:Putative secreted protein n=1 Tax=Ixodes ricinus TaxID=34613 RepID=A0A090XES7_IXORI